MLSAAIPKDHTYLPPHFEIRKLDPVHTTWANAIFSHSNTFYASIKWSSTNPENQAAFCYKLFRGADYLIRHQINSGMSFGIFDTTYKYQHPESVELGGKLYWDESDLAATNEQLLAQMDFPLVSIAMSYDAYDPPDMTKMADFMDASPLFGLFFGELEARDARDSSTRKVEGPQKVLQRNGTSTRADYGAQGLMKKLAKWLMHEAAGRGYIGIEIPCAHDAVIKAWLNPPSPFKASVVSQFDAKTYEKEVDGHMIKPFAPSEQVGARIYVSLPD
ncbi:hypothetical protein V1523DRAFT_424017 [Lipomyces doorenjongii]